jgi:peptidyl-prolyl cis-trans isomerase D
LAAQDESSGEGYYLLRVDAVTPGAVKPLEAVRGELATLWQQQKRDAVLDQLAKEIADAVSEGKSLADVAKAHNLATFTSAPLPRSGGDPKVPPLLVAKLFQAKPGGAVYARGNDGYAVAQLKEVVPPDPAKETDGIARLSEQLIPAMQDDLLQEFDRALRDRFPVSINQAAVARVL